MINPMMRQIRGASSWLLNPHCLIDKTLDHIERLSSLIVPDKVHNSLYRDASIETRVKEFVA